MRTHSDISRDWVLVGLLVAMSAIVLTPFARIDPDLHHDGFMLATAVAVSEGYSLYVGAFTHYGPVSHWAQGVVLGTTGPLVEALRLQTVAAYLVAITSFYLIIRISTGFRSLAFASSVLWLVMIPTIGGPEALYPMWAMPSALQLAVVMPGIVMTLLAVRKRCWIWALLSGVLFGTSTMMRFNYGLPVTVLVVAAIAALGPQAFSGSRKLAMWILFGFLLSVGAVIMTLWIQDSLSEFWYQTLAGAIRFGGTDVVQWKSFTPLVLLLGGLYLVLSIVVVALAKRQLTSLRVVLGLAMSAIIAGLLVSVSVGTRVRVLVLGSIFQAQPGSLPEVVASHASLSPLYASWLAVFLGGAWLVHTWLRPNKMRENSTERLPVSKVIVAVTLAAGLGMSAQAFPLFDTYHLWWAAGLMLPAAVTLLPWPTTQNGQMISVAILVVPIVLVNTWLGIAKLAEPRVAIESGVLKGMSVKIKDEDQFRSLDEFLSAIPVGPIRFLCPDGIYAVWSGEYRAHSAAHVNWAYGGREESDNGPYATSFDPDILSLPASLGDNETKTTVLCTNVDSGEQLEQWATERDLSVVNESVWIKPNLNAGYRLVRLDTR